MDISIGHQAYTRDLSSPLYSSWFSLTGPCKRPSQTTPEASRGLPLPSWKILIMLMTLLFSPQITLTNKRGQIGLTDLPNRWVWISISKTKVMCINATPHAPITVDVTLLIMSIYIAGKSPQEGQCMPQRHQYKARETTQYFCKLPNHLEVKATRPKTWLCNSNVKSVRLRMLAGGLRVTWNRSMHSTMDVFVKYVTSFGQKRSPMRSWTKKQTVTMCFWK